MPKNTEVIVQNLGLIPYQTAWDYQTQLFEAVIAQKINNRKAPPESQVSTPNYLLFCEHPHVYTLGKSGKESHLLLSHQELQAKGIEYFPINRGGDITYHGYGQVVGYPILDLDNFFTDIHKYLRFLEEAVTRTLAEYDIRAGRIEKYTGVWIDFEEQINPRKICAMGVKASRWVTMHGFALNVHTDLSYFEHIVPCGIEDKAVTSIEQELQQKIPMKDVQIKLQKHLAELFGMDLVKE